MNFLENLLKNYPYVRIHDDKRLYVANLIDQLIKDGREQLQIIADFDFTLTRYEKNGERLPSTFAVIETDPRVKFADGSLVRSKTDELRRKFNPIENDPQLSVEEKIPFMIEWWRTVQNHLVESNLNKSMIKEIVQQSQLELRKGVRTFFSSLFRNRIPILIFSAGLGDVIDSFLENEIPEFQNHRETSQIVSNFIRFDSNGHLLSFDEKIIHSFNKNEHEIDRTRFFSSIGQRRNGILFGDGLGDVGMAGGMKNIQNLLKIAFLNQTTEKKIEVYQIAFDLVICDNETFDVPNLILDSIFQ